MPVYILLFRGVGGATQLPTKPLREALTHAGFAHAGTYINSGNAYLQTTLSRKEMLGKVANLCKKQFAFTKEIHAQSLAEWRRLIRNNPFPEAVNAPKYLHAAVLAERPRADAIHRLQQIAVGGDRIEVVGKVAYIHTPHGFGTSKLAAQFDKGIGVANTARNWNSVLKLLVLAESVPRPPASDSRS